MGNSILSSNFLKSNSSQFTLLFGAITAQAISLISTFYIAYKLNPVIFGHYSFITMVLALLVPISTGKIDVLIVNSPEAELKILIKMAVKRITISSFIYASSLFLMAYIVWDYSAYSSLIIAVQINLVNIVLNFGIISIGFALKVRNFLAVAVSGVLQNGITFLIQYWLIELNYSIDSLLMGYIVGRFATLFSFLLWKRLRIYASIIRRKASAVSLSLATKDHKRNIFKAFSIDQLTLYSPIIFVCFVGDSETLGFTTLALTIAMAPAILLVSSFSMPFLKSEAETLNIFTQLDNLKNNYKFLIFTSIMYLISLEFFASWIISNFLGDQWTETSNLVRGFAIPFSLYIVMMPLLQRKIGLGNSKMIRQSNLFGLIGVLLASICGLLLILFFGISSSVSSILLFYGKIVAQSLHLVLVKLKSA